MVNQTTAFGLLFYNIFVPQKVPLSKMFDDVITCHLWFYPTPIKNPGYAYSLTVIQNQETPKLLIAIFAASLENLKEIANQSDSIGIALN